MSKSRGSPRKFSEKIALLNRKEAEATAEFEKILKEVEETTRAPPHPPASFHHYDQHQHQQEPKQYWGLPTRSSSFSSWQTSSSHAHQSHIHQQNHSQYLTEPVQFNGNQQLQQQHHQHQQQPQPQPQHQQQQQQPQHQQQQQGQHIDCATRLRPTVYIDNQHEQHNRATYQSSAQQQPLQQQQQLRRHMNQIDVVDGHVQPRPIGVPNIEIFPIDDNRSYSTHQQQQVTSARDTADRLTNGHFHPDSSNSSISSARSLPNIETLSVSPSSSSFMDTNKRHFLTQALNNQPLMPVVTSTPNDNHIGTDQPTSIMSAGENSPDNYAHSSTNDYFSGNDEYCSLPAIHEPISTDNNNQLDDCGQSRTNLSRTNSWQQVMTSSAPSSTAPTPPAIYQQQSAHSPNSSSHSQQHSPQNLHQNYYPIPIPGQNQGQMVRASSTNFINNDLLEAPRINSNLSKSTDAYYGYLDDYEANDTYFHGGLGNGGGDNFDNTGLITTTNSLMRSSNNDIDTIPMENASKQTNLCITTNQEQFTDTPQYQFYG